MSTDTEVIPPPESSDLRTHSLLRNGDRMTQTEFLRLYHAMPDVSHAELIEGRVYMSSSSSVSADRHGEPHFDLITWLGTYRAMTPGVVGGDNSTLQLDFDNEQKTLEDLLRRVGGFIHLYYLFFKCDTQTGDKNQASLKWFEQKNPEIERRLLGEPTGIVGTQTCS